jgi:Flp pilus assembly secretin CpaC
MRAVIASLALVVSTLVFAPVPAAAQSVSVPVDHTGLVRLPQDAATIVVGNPAIADAMLYDSRTLFLSGRVFGQTNLIALNADGQVIYAADVSITMSERNHVQILRNSTDESGVAQYTYVCDPVCRSSVTIGDDPTYFDTTDGQRSRVTAAATGAADAADGAN